MSQANGQVYIRLHGEKSLADNLKNLAISEFPTILVKHQVPEEWTIENAAESTKL
jgi:hypothetical protein